jgi:hypothetical protein
LLFLCEMAIIEGYIIQATATLRSLSRRSRVAGHDASNPQIFASRPSSPITVPFADHLFLLHGGNQCQPWPLFPGHHGRGDHLSFFSLLCTRIHDSLSVMEMPCMVRASPTRDPIICNMTLLIEFRTCFKSPGPTAMS